MSSLKYTVLSRAYAKLFLHAAKHPHKAINGILVGTQSAPSAPVHIVDAIPLLHHWTSLSPMMEIGLDLATQHAKENNMKVVGYYQACERLDDTALAPVGERIAGKVREAFPDAIAFVIDGENFGSGRPALIPYVPLHSTTSWRPATGPPAFTPGSAFQLDDVDIPIRSLALVREDHAHFAFGDFDDHLEDVTIDWLRNGACIPVGL